MKQVIYIDVLIIVNLFVNYFILLTTSKFLNLKLKLSRLILGEILGAIYSLYIFIPEPNLFISILIKLFMSVIMVAVSFEFRKIKQFLKIIVCFYAVNFAFSGTMFTLWCFLKPNGMIINNDIVYFNISPLTLIISTVISYTIIEIINRVIEKKQLKSSKYEIGIKFKDKYIVLNAKIDTGNLLKEPFSNLPVIVVKKSEINLLIPEFNIFESIENQNEIKKLKIRMIPFKTISGTGILPAFKPEYVVLKGNLKKQAYVAVCSDEYFSEGISCLVNPEILD
ncbi:MAG: sigma-E processing peptidase SpoIIGA [Clostridia bacterium]|nr:sigma-E processing peptidase SpoIIGA [Clostridia bacterium]